MEERSRRVEPVPEGLDPDEVFDPGSMARPGLSLWLLAGPCLAVAGLLGWLRLLNGVDKASVSVFSWAHFMTDLGLLVAFLLPHSMLSRGFGRRWLNRPFGPEAERPLFILVTGITLATLALSWETCGPLLWKHEGGMKLLARALQSTGLLLAAWAIFVAGTGRFLGLPHLKALETGRQAPRPEFVALPPFSWLRQPVKLGFLLLLLGMTAVTVDRLLLGGLLSLWFFASAPWGERDTELRFGEGYADYRERTPRWIPRIRLRDS